MRLPTLAAATVALALALAGTASADSISFLRGGDIWVASPDGSKQVQITHSGIYAYQSQADDGTFIALAGRNLHRIDRQGNVLADFSTPVSGDTGPDDSKFVGPFDPEISPDGTKVVYGYLWYYHYNKPGCTGPDWMCQEKHTFQGVAFSHADRMTAWSEPGMDKRSGWIYPSWTDNNGIIGSTPSEPLNNEVMYHRLDDGSTEFQDWFTDEGVWYTKDGEVSRAGDKAVFVTTAPYGLNDEYQGTDDQVTVYKMSGPPPALPERCYSIGDRHMNASPTLSPDGGRVAYQRRTFAPTNDQSDTYDVLVADTTLGCNPDGGAITSGTVVLSDAKQPDWGPADVPSETTVEPPKIKPPEVDGPDKPEVVKPAGQTVRTKALAVRGAALRRALRRGLVVRFKAPGAGAVKASATLGRKVVATGSKRVGRAGTVSVRLRFTGRARKALRGKRAARLSVRMVFRAA
jgi:hypothetical protein